MAWWSLSSDRANRDTEKSDGTVVKTRTISGMAYFALVLPPKSWYNDSATKFIMDIETPDTQDTQEPTSSARPRVRRRVRLGSEVRERRRRIARYVLLAVSTVLMVNALVGENGYLASLRASQRESELNSNLSRLRAENAALIDEARRLRSDPDTLEAVAREDLGLIKPGETLITLRDKARQ